jgi:hypothetical protein
MSKRNVRKQPEKLKRVVIKEELVELTGDYITALVLNQFIYWSERVKDYDKMLKEEKKRLDMTADDAYEFKNGWIWKSAPEMIDELMIGVSTTTMERRLKKIVDNSWAQRRKNPNNPQDHTYQYRIDIIKIQIDLLKLGYSLDNYPVIVDRVSNLHSEGTKLHDEASDLQNEASDLHSEGSNLHDEGTVPEITTETTPKTISEIKKKYIKKKIDKNNFKTLYQQMLNFLESVLNNASFNTWFHETAPIDLKGGTFVISAPNDFIKEWIENQYIESMEMFLKAATDEDIKIKLLSQS